MSNGLPMGVGFQPILAMANAGAVSYTVQHARAGCGWGPWEAHPNRVPVERDGSVMLEHNGEWIASGPLAPGMENYALVCTGRMGALSAREEAERICAFRNEGKPTRVVDVCGMASASKHTYKGVVQATPDVLKVSAG